MEVRFMATVPLSGTNIRLLSGVPFSNDYKNTRWFDSQTAQENYFLSKPVVHTLDNYTFQRIEGRNFIRVKQGIDSLWSANYLMFKNETNIQWWYAFVTKLEYVQKNVTDVYFEIDVFQSWFFYSSFKPSYVVREHCPLRNPDNSLVINTIDEGLNYGTEYETVAVQQYRPFDDLLFLVIVSKSAMHTGSGATANEITPKTIGMPQPLSYYVHPFKIDGSTPSLSIAGASRSLSSINNALKGIFKQDDAVNNVVSLYVTDNIGRWVNYDGSNVNFDDEAFAPCQIADNTNATIDTVYVKGYPDFDTLTESMGSKYSGFWNMTETKLMMYPYCITVLDDMKGNRVEIKNEYITGDDLIIRSKGSLGPSNKTAFSVDNYLVDSSVSFDDKIKTALEHSLINNTPNDISILNDYLSAYLQGNRNSIENQKSAAMFNATIGTLTGSTIGAAQSTHFRGVNPSMSGVNPIGLAGAGLQVVSGVGQAVIELQGIQAKQNDAKNTPPQMVKMGGNTAFDYGNGLSGIYIIKKQITKEYRDTLSNFFNMFGYKVNRVKVPNFHTRQNWNYVQTSNCMVTGNLNNEDLKELKGVFDNGITLWHTDDVGNYALANGVI